MLTPAALRALMATAEWRPGMSTADVIAQARAEGALLSWRAWLPALLGPPPSADPVEAASARAAALESELEDVRAELIRLLPLRRGLASCGERADGGILPFSAVGAHLSEVSQ